jgi:hypothetical protein
MQISLLVVIFEWESSGAKVEVCWGHSGSLVGLESKYGGDIMGA